VQGGMEMGGSYFDFPQKNIPVITIRATPAIIIQQSVTDRCCIR
jgi:hypothetical protein